MVYFQKLGQNAYLCTMQNLYLQYKQALSSLYTPHEISLLFRDCVAHVLQVDVQQTYFLSDIQATDDQQRCLLAYLHALKNHTPLQYVLGKETFMDLSFAVTPDVLIPRPETAELVRLIIQQHQHCSTLRILDMGTGSGCIAIALAHYLPQAQVTAIDFSEKALSVAQKNAQSIGVNVEFIQADMLSENLLPHQEFDVIVSNPPYIMDSEKQDMQANVLNFEPHTALFVPDADPLLFYRAIAAYAHRIQVPSVYVEINRQLGEPTQALFTPYGYQTALLHDDFSNPRFVIATR